MHSFFVVSGLILGLYLYAANLPFFVLISVILFSFFFIRFRLRKTLLFLLGFAIGILFTIVVWFVPVGNGSEFKGMIIESKDNYIIVQSGANRYYVSQSNNSFEVFDYVSISGRITRIQMHSLESRFNFGDYLHGKGVNHEIVYSRIDTIFASFLRPRMAQNALTDGLSSTAQGYINSFVFGDKDYGQGFLRIAQQHSLSHIFGLSGLYVYSLAKIVEYIVNLKFSKRVSNLTSIALVAIFFFISSYRLSIMRILIFRIVRHINVFYLKKRFSSLEVISISFLIILGLNPFSLFDSSFYVSGLIVFMTIFTRNILRRFSLVKRVLVSTTFISLLLLPYSISMNHAFDFLSLVLQPFFLLVSYPSFYFSLLSLARLPCDWYFLFINDLMLMMDGFLGMMSFPLFAPPLTDYMTSVYLISYIFLLFSIDIRVRKLQLVSIFVFVIIGSSIFVPFKNILSEGSVTFIDVGQGDSTLIQTRYGNVLIDTGGNTNYDMATEVLIPFLRKRQVYTIDYLIITHHDYDHNGAVDSLMDNFQVKKYVDTIRHFPLKLGKFEINNLNIYQDFSKDNNYNSLVLQFLLNNKNYLIMGDAPAEIEARIVDNNELDCDVLRVGHHGSNTSTSDYFIERINPQSAVISCGYNNRYGHPHSSVISTLGRANITIRRTDLEGTIYDL